VKKILSLESLCRPNKPFHHELPDEKEFVGLLRSGEARLKDASKTGLALESRYDLAYNAAHAISLAALRRLGYRAANRYIVFQVLEHTLGMQPPVWRVLAKAHDLRNLSEYEGIARLNESIVRDLIVATDDVLIALKKRMNDRLVLHIRQPMSDPGYAHPIN
jgi:hypothetical protein